MGFFKGLLERFRKKNTAPPEPLPKLWRRWYDCPACMQGVVETPERPNHYDSCSYFEKHND